VAGGKNLLEGWVLVGGGGHKELGNEGEYGGCALYPYMKIQEWNLLKFFKEDRGGGKKENDRRGKSN
jgi:hypothetical protein